MGSRRRTVRQVEARPGSRLDQLLTGKLSVDDLTEEELLTGILNDKNGERSGRPPNLIPRDFHTAVVRRVIEIGEEKLRSGFVEAAENLVRMATLEPEVEPFGPRVDPSVLRAAQYLYERVAGKIPDKVEHSGEVKGHERIAVFINRNLPKEEDDEAQAGAG